MPPSKQEAFAAISDVLYAIDQCLALCVWARKVKPILTEVNLGPQAKLICQLMENSILESTLVFVRKLNEFFGSRQQRDGDEALRAYHFGKFDDGWFLTKEEYEELHLGVCHMSVEEVRRGKKLWPVQDYIRRVLATSCSFLQFLLTCPELNDELRPILNQKIQEIQELKRIGFEFSTKPASITYR